jgi:hypothetical protein
MPERETPGTNAVACNVPMTRLELVVTAVLWPWGRRSTAKSTSPTPASVAAMSGGQSCMRSNTCLNARPSTIAGMLARTR